MQLYILTTTVFDIQVFNELRENSVVPDTQHLFFLLFYSAFNRYTGTGIICRNTCYWWTTHAKAATVSNVYFNWYATMTFYFKFHFFSFTRFLCYVSIHYETVINNIKFCLYIFKVFFFSVLVLLKRFSWNKNC